MNDLVQKPSARFREIIRVFSRYGLEYVFYKKSNDNKLSQNLRKAFEELGPTFIKIGQILSTRLDLLPGKYIDELVKLQDSIPEEPFEIMKEVFEKSINQSIEDIFDYVNNKSIASASIAQVYEGILKDGRSVVIKIQRPEIYEKMRLDISILMRILRFTKSRISLSKIIDPSEALEEICLSTEEELNFKLEADNINKFRKYNKDVVPVYAPYVVSELVSDKVLVLEKIDGVKINSVKTLLRNGYDTTDIAKKLALSYCKQIFEDGFFHGDPHPGNLLVSDRKICFIDFGIMGRLSNSMRGWLNDSMMAVALKDKEKLVQCILSVAIKKGQVSKVSIYDSVSYILDTYLSTSIKNIKLSLLMQEILKMTKENNIRLPRELISLTRGLIILEGVVSGLDPELEIIDVIISFMKSKKKMMILKYLQTEESLIVMCSFFRDTLKIPTKTVEVLNKLSEGKSQLNININERDKIIIQFNKMVNRIIAGVLISACMLSSALILSSNVKLDLKSISIAGLIGYVIASVFSIILLISMIKARNYCDKDKK